MSAAEGSTANPDASITSRRISGQTKVAGVIGHPVGHSLSPAMYNAAFEHLGLDWIYAAWDVAPDRGEAAVGSMRVLGLEAMSVTMPHKQAAFAACDELSPAAQALEAVNCVSKAGDTLTGHNTDGAGLLRALEIGLNSEVAGLRVSVFGAGGAARAAALALCESGANVEIVNRSPDKAANVVQMVEQSVPGACKVASTVAEAVSASQVLINATPLGMSPGDPLPFDVDLIETAHLVVDLIYHPSETPLLKEAKTRGASAANGVGMLLYQAAEQFQIWTGLPAPVDVMAAAAAVTVAERPNPSAPNTDPRPTTSRPPPRSQSR